MRTISVDDRQLAVNALIRVLKEIDPEGSHAGLISSVEAIRYVKSNDVDIAFLDIEMPDINGLVLAKALKDIKPNLNIVFVTGHMEYAFDAHKIFASGYLIKPASKEDILAVLDHLRNPIERAHGKLRVRCFGSFEVFVDDEPLIFRRSKSKELFAYLIDNNGGLCSIGELLSVLWEDGENTPSRNSLIRTCISDLRKTFDEKGYPNIIKKEYNAVAVLVDELDCDYYNFLKKDPVAVNQYMGEYMKQYPWAEMRIPELSAM